MANRPEPIDIVMTTWKREIITLLSLDCLTQNTDFPFRLIILDNGSDPYAQLIYESIADVYVKFDENKGLEYAKNYGMQYVSSRYFISTDNDILVPKRVDGADWLSNLFFLMVQNKEYGAIALRPQVLVGTGDIFGENPPEIKEFSHVPGYMRIMETDLVKELGAWNDKRPLRGHEEYWISERMRDAGRKVGWSSYIRCYHLFGQGNWGYSGSMTPEDTGHNPTSLPVDDIELIKKDFYEI